MGEVYQKVLDAIAWYRQEKATQAQYQEYKAQTAVGKESETETAHQSLSPTVELEENVERLIHRAEKTNRERAKELRRIKKEALQVRADIEGTRWEETRWQFYDWFDRPEGTNEADQTSQQITEADKSRVGTESGGSNQEKEGSKTSREEFEARKEEGEVYQEETSEPTVKPLRNARDNLIHDPALEINEQSDRDVSGSPNKTKLRREGTVEITRPTDSETSDVLNPEETGDRVTAKALKADVIQRSEGKANPIPKGLEPREDDQRGAQTENKGKERPYLGVRG